MNTKEMNLKEKIKKLRDELYGIYVDYLSNTKGGKREIDTTILNFIEAEIKAERGRILKLIVAYGDGKLGVISLLKAIRRGK